MATLATTTNSMCEKRANVAAPALCTGMWANIFAFAAVKPCRTGSFGRWAFGQTKGLQGLKTLNHNVLEQLPCDYGEPGPS
jgi:hypothetical protein